MDSKDIQREYDLKAPSFKQLEVEAKHIIHNALDSSGIKIHNITSRVKKFDSFLKKIEMKESDSPFENIKDIVGLRIVCLLRSDIPKLADLIRNEFLVIEEDNKIDGYEISSFGYQSIHFNLTMKTEHSGPRYDPIKGIIFEIQLRTVSMDAWATISHYLDYKTDKDVPSDLRKDFYALSGLFYVADTHFELFYQSGIKSKEFSEKKIQDEGATDEELNLDTLRAYLNNKIKDHEKSEIIESYSSLLNELFCAGYKTINKLDQQIEKGWEAFIEYENNNPPDGEMKYNVIGALRSLMTIVDENYFNCRKSGPTNIDEFIKYRHLVKK